MKSNYAVIIFRKRREKMKKTVLVFLFLILLLGSCKGNNNMKELMQDEVLYTQIKDTCDYEKVRKVFDQSSDVNCFCDLINVDVYKRINDIRYTVIKTEEGLLLASFEEKNDSKKLRKIRFSSDENIEKVQNITIGMSINDIHDADPDGIYDYMCANWSEYPTYSFHFFENGDCYFFSCTGNIITEIIKFTI